MGSIRVSAVYYRSKPYNVAITCNINRILKTTNEHTFFSRLLLFFGPRKQPFNWSAIACKQEVKKIIVIVLNNKSSFIVILILPAPWPSG